MTLRPVDVAPPVCPVAEEIRAIAEQAIREGAGAFYARWEAARNYNEAVAPRLECAKDGLVRSAWEQHQNDTDGAE